MDILHRRFAINKKREVTEDAHIIEESKMREIEREETRDQA